VQDLVLQGLVQGFEEYKANGGQGGLLAGTSNVSSPRDPFLRTWCPGTGAGLNLQVYFALKYGLKPAGTIAHEWIMAIGATYGYKGANGRAMDMWEEGKFSLLPQIPV
jgi:nicotinate phosphoribosyltransferase